MRVFLINPSSIPGMRAGAYSNSMLPAPPLGIAYLAEMARSLGHDVQVEDQYASGISAEAIAEMAARRRSDVVGIGCLSPNMPMVEAIIHQIRRRLPSSHITVGNLHATLFAPQLLETLPIDTVVMGEGEATFSELLDCLEGNGNLNGIRGIAFKTDRRIAVNPPRAPLRDLDRLPRPAWDLLRLSDYRCPPRLLLKGRILPVQTTRGCPWRCTFCSQNLLTPGLRRRTMHQVVDEIEWLNSTFGITNFGFQDAVFPLDPQQGFELCRLLTDRGLHRTMRWFTQTRCDCVTLPLLAEMKRSGCVFVMYGFESGCNRHLEVSSKQFTTDQARKVMRWMHTLDFPAYGLFMIGFPHETLAEARHTIAFAKHLDCLVASFSRVTPYPGTPLYDRYRGTFPQGVFPWQWNSQYRWSEGQPDWQLPGLSSRRINRLLREAMIGYYLRPRMIRRHLAQGLLTPAAMLEGGIAMLKDLIWV